MAARVFEPAAAISACHGTNDQRGVHVAEHPGTARRFMMLVPGSTKGAGAAAGPA